MSEVPDDLMKVAREVAEQNAWPTAAVTDHVTIVLARALAAEREACAAVARDTTRLVCRGDFGLVGPAGIGFAIAEAILARP